MQNPLRNIPSVNELLEIPPLRGMVDRVSHSVVVSGVRTFLSDFRDEVQTAASEFKVPTATELAERIAEWIVKDETPSLRPVINATGILLHTGLGRAPLAGEAIQAMSEVAAGYSSVEVDLATGERSQRVLAVESLLTKLTGAEAAVVTNNNAAATLLALTTLAAGREVIVSRGQLIEIGGSFRLPDVMTASGARLREVGTTNKTRLADYEQAIGEETAALMNVHTSNYRVVGFTEEAELEELAALGRDHGVPVIEDLGSGCLFDLRDVGIHDEPTVAQRLATGVDLVTFSGDKLLGGPQAGFIVGKPDYVARVRSNPLYRALRLDKATTLALEGTLAIYVNGDLDGIPTIRMLRMPIADLESRAKAIADRLMKEECGALLEIVKVFSQVGGGGAPGKDLPSFGLSINPPDTAHALVARLRDADPPIIARIVRGRVILDVRTVLPDEDDALVGSVAKALID